MSKRNFLALAPSAANVWEKKLEADHACTGTFIQNQHATAKFWICNCEPSRIEQAQLIGPGSGLLEDIHPGTEEVWIMTDTAGAALTFTKKRGA